MINDYAGWKVPHHMFQLEAIDLSEDNWPWNVRSSNDNINIVCPTRLNTRNADSDVCPSKSLSVKERQELIQNHVFENFVRMRKPVIFRATKEVHWLSDNDALETSSLGENQHPLLKLLEMPALQAWSSPHYASHLSKLAGSIEVDVEVRSSVKETFGKGSLETMSFQQFLNRLQSPKDRGLFYLTASSKSSTTSDRNTGKEHAPVTRKRKKGNRDNPSMTTTIDRSSTDFFMPPLVKFLHQNGRQFPRHPYLLGALIPSSIHIWMGQSFSANSNSDDSASFASSGLHHDFHDNLYILLRGFKQFRLYAPCDAEFLYLHGKISRIHGNGLINFCGDEDGDTTSDGIPVSIFEKSQTDKVLFEKENERRKKFRMLTKRKEEVEQRMKEIEENANDDSEVDSVKNMRDAEQELEEILDLWVDFQNEYYSDSCDESTDYHDDYFHYERKDGDTHTDCTTYTKNFSMIPTTLLSEEYEQSQHSKNELIEKYPLFQRAKVAYCQLKAGEALYLPASWFHEVSSSSQLKETDTGAHLALNFWFHPPNNLNRSCCSTPYKSDYWLRHWNEEVSS